jgi:hypothetical protein
MATNNLGLGAAPLGVTPMGFGAPATATSLCNNILEDNYSVKKDARYIDPLTKDYKIDVNGVTEGMSSVAQQVYLALVSYRNSTSVPGLGSSLSDIKTYNKNTITSLVTDKVKQALKTLIDSKTISLGSVSVLQFPNKVALQVTVSWTDLSTNTLHNTSL